MTAHTYGLDAESVDGIDWAVVMGALQGEAVAHLRSTCRDPEKASGAFGQSCRDALAFIDAVSAGAPAGELWPDLSERARREVVSCLPVGRAFGERDAWAGVGRELLRRQVKDFIQWLRAEGVI